MTEYGYQLTADSGCDLSLALCAERDIVPYKMPYTMDGETIIDEMTEESFKKFYDLMRAGGYARTSQINPDSFVTFWRPFAEAGRPVLHISLAAAISGSYANALTAIEILHEDFPDWKCRVVDSANASAGVGLMVLRAADSRDAGVELDANADELDAVAHNVSSIFTTADLIYLYRGGRVSRVAAAFGTALNIVPIMHLDYEGHLEVWQKVRGEKQCMARIISDIKELVVDPQNQTLIISEADNIEKARLYGDALISEVGFRDVFYTHIGPTIGAHTGPGLISIFFVGKERV